MVDEDVVDAVAETAENQVEADRNASITDRVKMGGESGIV